jgi:diguanylate cyclase (GGDEF)-like protein
MSTTAQPRDRRRLNALVLSVCLSGAAVVATLLAGLLSFAPVHLTTEMVVLALALLLGELRPVKVARGEEGDDEITISSTFAMALVITGPLAVAVGAQIGAALFDDVRRRKPAQRVLFNAAQYTLTLAAARLVYALITHQSILGATPVMSTRGIVGALAGGLAFFVVNHGIVGTAVALDMGVHVGQRLRNDVRFQMSTSGVLLTFAPVVVGTMNQTNWLLPLLLLPILAIHKTAALAAERQQQALHDDLTGLPNRALLQDRTTRVLVDRMHGGHSLAVMLLDLDHFKEINDTLGHHVGDVLIREVGMRLQVAVREGDTVARLGGDEFAVLVSSMTSADDAVQVAERIVTALREPFTIDGVRLDVQASIGIAISPEHGTDVETLIQRADVALYTAKEERGCWAMYCPESDRYTVERLALLGELRAGLETGQLTVFYQPKSDAHTGMVVGMEALARWVHPTRGMLPPDEFIPLAENTGLIGELTFEVLRQALSQARSWHQQGMRLGVSVNLSARQLTDLDLPRAVEALLSEFGLAPTVLTLEVTESTIMADPSRTLSVLRLLAELGICLSIDDFGTGYSSLSYLKRVEAHELKIDKSFIMGMSHNSNDAVIVRSTIELGHNLGLRMVAEGVEDAETWRLLRALGCDVVQGFHLSRPLPPAEITRWLSEHNLRVDLEDALDSLVPSPRLAL